MKKGLRTVIFYFFASAFLISAPLIVLYTAGFRISLNNQRIQQTGAVAISTNPRGVSVSVSGTPSTSKTPTVIQNILPSDIDVHLEKRGYLPWDGKVHVNAGQTTYITALLFSNAEASLHLPILSTAKIAANPDGRYLAIFQLTEQGAEISLYDVVTRHEKSVQTLPPAAFAYALTWSKDGTYILLSDQDHPMFGFALSDGHEEQGKNLTKLLEDKSAATFVDNGGNIEVHAGPNANGKLVALLPKGTYDVLEADDDYLILADARKKPYIVSLTNSDVVSFDVAASAYDWLADENRLVWTDGLEVNTYDADTKTRTFFTRQSELITNVMWHPSSQAIIIATANHISALDTETYKDRARTELISTTGTITAFWIDSSGKNLYYIDQGQDSPGLYLRKLNK